MFPGGRDFSDERTSLLDVGQGECSHVKEFKERAKQRSGYSGLTTIIIEDTKVDEKKVPNNKKFLRHLTARFTINCRELVSSSDRPHCRGLRRKERLQLPYTKR